MYLSIAVPQSRNAVSCHLISHLWQPTPVIIKPISQGKIIPQPTTQGALVRLFKKNYLAPSEISFCYYSHFLSSSSPYVFSNNEFKSCCCQLNLQQPAVSILLKAASYLLEGRRTPKNLSFFSTEYTSRHCTMPVHE